MAAITWTDVTNHAPNDANIANASAGAQADILALVNTHTAVAVLDGEAGSKTKLARIYMAAHLATMEARRGAAGTLTSQTAGPLSRGYTLMPWLTRSELSLTSYGLNYLAIIKRSAARGGLVL